MQDDRIAGGLNALHGGSEEIAGRGLHHVLRPCAAMGALLLVTAMAAIYPLVVFVVLEDDDAIAAGVRVKPRDGIGELAAGRELHPQEVIVTP
jgi:hypothetical protein